MSTFSKFMVYSFCLSLLFISCDKENNNDNGDIVANTSNSTISSLKNFNDSVFILNKSNTRGFGGWFLRASAVASADVLGAAGGFRASVSVAAFITAATGGTAGPATAAAVLASSGICGIGASYGAYRGVRGRSNNVTCSIIVPASQIYENDLLNQIIGKWSMKSGLTTKEILSDDVLNSYGELHNKVLQDLMKEEFNENKTRGQYGDETTPEEKEVTEVFSIPIFSKTELDEMYSNSMSYITPYIESYDYDKTLNSATKDGTLKNVSDVLSLYFEALRNYVTNAETLSIVNNKYIDVIKKSPDISIDDKNALLIGFYLSKYSFNLWTANEYLQN